MSERDEDRIMSAAARLTTEVRPERDLWPGIEEAIRKPQRSWWTPMLAQAAAVVLLVGASSMVTYVLVKEEPQIIEVERPALNTVFASYARANTLGADYDEARGAVATQLDRELERLSPQTRDEVDRNLAVIRQAIAEISKALEQEPDNRLLQDLLVDTYREEVAIMQKVGRLTNQVLARQDI